MFGPSQAQAAPVAPPPNHTAVSTDFDLDLLRIFCIATGNQGLSATGTNTLVGSYVEDLPDWQMRIIPSLGAGVPWLLSRFRWDSREPS